MTSNIDAGHYWPAGPSIATREIVATPRPAAIQRNRPAVLETQVKQGIPEKKGRSGAARWMGRLIGPGDGPAALDPTPRMAR